MSYIQEIAEALPEHERLLARTVVTNFVQQCERLSKISVQIPALKIPREADYSAYNYDRSKHPIAIKLEALVQRIEKAQKDIEICFLSVTPQ